MTTMTRCESCGAQGVNEVLCDTCQNIHDTAWLEGLDIACTKRGYRGKIREARIYSMAHADATLAAANKRSTRTEPEVK